MANVAVVPLSIAFTGVMLTALFGVHLRYGFSSIRLKSLGPGGAEFGPVGYELNLLYIAALLAIALEKRRNKTRSLPSLSSAAGDGARARR
jgi:hypothetical protein